jgi:BirA family biotin operon repressor/biotin-[acetyl-CoA-carboxylase] ligase
MVFVAHSSSLPPDLAAALAGARGVFGSMGSTVHYFRETGSTNDVAAALAADGAAEGTVVIADAQTAGRGRSGRRWFSPPGAGLYVSVILRPAAATDGSAAATARLLTLAAGVAVADGIEAATRLPVQIKWPNDIVIADSAGPVTGLARWRKLAGILAEGHSVGGALEHVVLGYGINLQPAAYPPDVSSRATSLEAELGRPVDRGAVFVQTLLALRREYDGLHEDPARMFERWRLRSPSCRGWRVTWDLNGERVEGVTDGIDEYGALRIRAGTRVIRAAAGEVEWS